MTKNRGPKSIEKMWMHKDYKSRIKIENELETIVQAIYQIFMLVIIVKLRQRIEELTSLNYMPQPSSKWQAMIFELVKLWSSPMKHVFSSYFQILYLYPK